MSETYTELRLSMRRVLKQGDLFRVVGISRRTFVFDYATTNAAGDIIVSAKDTRRKTFRAFYADRVRPVTGRRRVGG